MTFMEAYRHLFKNKRCKRNISYLSHQYDKPIEMSGIRYMKLSSSRNEHTTVNFNTDPANKQSKNISWASDSLLVSDLEAIDWEIIE